MVRRQRSTYTTSLFTGGRILLVVGLMSLLVHYVFHIHTDHGAGSLTFS
jgi:hypothetical protein